MPCFSSWKDHLQPGTPEYLRAQAEVEAQLRAVRHIVDYYYAAHDLPVRRSPMTEQVPDERNARVMFERAIRKMLCHHFACDGIHAGTLGDVCSLLNDKVEPDRAYLAILVPCAQHMCEHPDTYPVQRPR